MFGHRYFGKRYFGPRYFGPKVAASGGFLLGVGVLAIVGRSVGVGFTGPSTGVLRHTGRAPSAVVSNVSSIPIPAGSLAYTGRLLVPLTSTTAIPVPVGRLVYTGRAPLVLNSSLRIGLDANPYMPTIADFTEQNQRYGFRRASTASVDFLHFSRPWNQAETSAGVYDLNTLSWMLQEHPGKVSVTLPVINFDGTRNLPAYLGSPALDDSTVITAYQNLLDAVFAVTGDRVEYVSLGQEVEGYLSAHASEISTFANLISAIKTKVTALWPGRPTIVSFKSTVSASVTTTYAAIVSAVTKLGFTYYFINPDYTIRDSNLGTMDATLDGDIFTLYTNIGGLPIIITEAGCPSHVDLGSSETHQAQFVTHMLTVCQVYNGLGLMSHVAYLWQSDWSPWLLDLFGFTGDVRKYISTLGLRTDSNTSKSGFAAFVTFNSGVDAQIPWVPIGQLVYTGRAPLIIYFGNFVVSLPKGTLNVVGRSVGPAFPGPGLGALRYAGYAPAPTIGGSGGPGTTINIPVGTFKYTGRYVSVAFLNPPAGSLIFTGRQPLALVSGQQVVFLPAGSSIVWQGRVLTLTGPIVIPIGRLVHTGRAPALVFTGGGTIAIPKGTLTYAGRAPLLPIGGPIPVAARLTINFTERTMANGWNITFVANHKDMLRFEVLSINGVYRPQEDDLVEVSKDGVVLFGGFITNAYEKGVGDEWLPDIVTDVTAMSFEAKAERRHATKTIDPGTLKQALVILLGENYLESVTLSPSQADGPMLPQLIYEDTLMDDVLADLVIQTNGWTWKIDHNQVFLMSEPSTQPAPFNIIQPSPYCVGDVSIEKLRADYKNYIVVKSANFRKIAQNAGQIALRQYYEAIYTAPDETPEDAMQAQADGLLARGIVILKKAVYMTRTPGLFPGMSQTITLARRNVNNIFLIEEVMLQQQELNEYLYTVTAIEGLVYQTGWREIYKGWSEGSGRSATGGIVGGGGGGGSSFVRNAYVLNADINAAVRSVTPTWAPASGGASGQGAVQVQLNTVTRGTTSATIVARLRALDAGVTVRARLFDATDSVACPELSAVVTSTQWVTVSWTVTLTPGSHLYELQLLPGTGDVDVQGTGYIE